MGKGKGRKAEMRRSQVTMRALVRRINRRLPTVVGENPDTQTPIVGVNRKVLTGCRLSAVRSSKQRMKFGGFVLVNHDSYADDSTTPGRLSKRTMSIPRSWDASSGS